ncbi:MAG: response regulator transcription factor [Limnochordales bacterium]
MSSIGVGLLTPRRLPRSPLMAGLHKDPRVRIVFEVHDVHDLKRCARRRAHVHVIVADMDVTAGVRTILRVVKMHFADAPVVMLDEAGNSARAQRARALGVAAVLARRTPSHRLVSRLVDVARERAWAPETFDAEAIEPLTPREWDILPYIAQRYSAKEIAEELEISTSTVRTHLRNIYAKCGVGSRRHAAYVAETLLRERYMVGDNRGEEVSRDDGLRRRDGRSDPQSERDEVHPGPGGDRGGARIVRQQGPGPGQPAGGQAL